MGMAILLLTITLLFITFIFSPKHLKFSEFYSTSLFADFLASLADMYFDLEYDLYGFFGKGANWQYILVFLFVYPGFSSLFLNYFPYERPLLLKILYIGFCSVASLLFELMSIKTGLFYYHGWKWWYSAGFYPLLYTTMYFNLKFLRKLNTL